MTRRRLVAIALALCVAAAFALRTIPSYPAVFIASGVSFQEADAWFHMRMVHNLLAHFPYRSGFDPYALYPATQNVPTGPMFDLLLGSVAWLLGLGSPSPQLIDRVGAWTPAVLGASFPLLVFWLGRLLFSEAAGLLSAAWIALLPGGLLWEGHLGMPDHHVLESWLALVIIALVCSAVEAVSPASLQVDAVSAASLPSGPPVAVPGAGRSRALWLTAASGIALGAYLSTRPAGIFVPAILITAVLLHPGRTLARVGLGTFVIATLVFLPSYGIIWSGYTLLSLVAGIAAMSIALAAESLWRRRQWPAALLTPAVLATMALALAAILVLRPALLASLRGEIARVAGFTGQTRLIDSVNEMRPLIRSSATPLASVFNQLGVAWIFALPALASAVGWAWRSRRAAAIIFIIWSLAMTVAGLMEVRMVVYLDVNVALLAGVAGAWLIQTLAGFVTALQVSLVTAALVALICATNLTWALPQMRESGGPTADWLQALTWLRDHSPEPMGDPSAYLKRYAALAPGQAFAYPPSAYSVAVWWDAGYWVESIARRMPSANGTQAGAGVTARLLTDTSLEDARVSVHELGARYVVIDPSHALVDQSGHSQYPNLVAWAQRSERQYVRVFFSRENEELRPVLLFLPDFYRSLAVRLYTFDGRPAHVQKVWVISSERDSASPGEVNVLREARAFGSDKEAREFVAQHPEETLTIGGLDPTQTCIELEAASGFQEVLTTGRPPQGATRTSYPVKVFQVER